MKCNHSELMQATGCEGCTCDALERAEKAEARVAELEAQLSECGRRLAERWTPAHDDWMAALVRVKVAEARVAELEAQQAMGSPKRRRNEGPSEVTPEAAAEDTRREYVPRGQGEAAGWIRIGRYDDARRRALWVRFVGLDDSYPVKCKAIELCAGREGDDSYVRIRRRGQAAFFDALFDTLLRAADHIQSRWAAAQSKGDQCSDKTVSRDTAEQWAQSGEPLPEDGVLASSSFCGRCFCACDCCIDRARGRLVPVCAKGAGEEPR